MLSSSKHVLPIVTDATASKLQFESLAAGHAAAACAPGTVEDLGCYICNSPCQLFPCTGMPRSMMELGEAKAGPVRGPDRHHRSFKDIDNLQQLL